jgi:hypothetical protein
MLLDVALYYSTRDYVLAERLSRKTAIYSACPTLVSGLQSISNPRICATSLRVFELFACIGMDSNG